MNDEKLFNNPQFSDVKIVIGDETFYAHKVILARNSKYFETRFTTGVGNPNSDVIIEDLAFVHCLKYMYIGDKFPLNKDNIISLMEYADMYMINSLKVYCNVWLAGLGNDYDSWIIRITVSKNDMNVVIKALFECKNYVDVGIYINNLSDEDIGNFVNILCKRPVTSRFSNVSRRILKWLENVESIEFNYLQKIIKHLIFESKNDYLSLRKLNITTDNIHNMIHAATPILDPFSSSDDSVPYGLGMAIVDTILDKLNDDLSNALTEIEEYLPKTKEKLYYYGKLFRIIKLNK